jgi:hypothetical protein
LFFDAPFDAPLLAEQSGRRRKASLLLLARWKNVG